MWIHYERLHNHNKAKHNKTMWIFVRIQPRFEKNDMHLNETKNTAMGKSRHFDNKFGFNIFFCIALSKTVKIRLNWDTRPLLSQYANAHTQSYLIETEWCVFESVNYVDAESVSGLAPDQYKATIKTYDVWSIWSYITNLNGI